MHLLELAVQGARGFSPTARVQLKNGYWVLGPPTPATPPLCALLAAICFPDGRGGDSALLAPGLKTGKVAITFLGKDNATYRVVRDLGGQGGLQKYNAAAQRFDSLATDAADVVQMVRNQVGLPSRGTFEQLFCFTLNQLPSRRPKPAAPGAAKAAGPQLATAKPVEAASDIGATKARIAALEKELAHSKEVDGLQYRLDSLSQEVFAAEQKLKSTDAIQQQLKDAEAVFARAPTTESLGLPADILARLKRYPQALQKRDEALAKLEIEKENDAQQVERHVPPLWKDNRFLAGAGLGVVTLGLGIALSGMGRYLALLDIPSFGFAALVALKYVDDVQSSKRVSRRGGMIASREKKILDDFAAEDAPVKQAMQAVRAETPEEVFEALAQRSRAEERVNQLREQLATIEADPDYVAARDNAQKLKAEHEAINGELTEKGAYARDLREIEREIARAKESIELAMAGGGAPAPAASAAPASPAERLPDPVPALLSLGMDLFTADRPTVVSLIRERVAKYLQALTDRRYTAAEFDKDGNATVVAASGKVSARDLAPRDLDFLYLAIRFTFVEKYNERMKTPIVLEDVFVGMEEPKVLLLGRMLKHIGAQCQVVHVTAHPGIRQAADGAAKL
jgi:hypothetical protein